MPQVVLVVDNVRSAHNVGSLLRTADGLGVSRVYLCGYTPYPLSSEDKRLPHIAAKTDAKIRNTSLGAENHVGWQHAETAKSAIETLKCDGYTVAALEQTPSAQELSGYAAPDKIALIVGSEVGGLSQDTLDSCSVHLQIPMRGRKESFNVAVAAAIALHHLAKTA